MLGAKVKFYVNRSPIVMKEGVIQDKILLKEGDVAITGYLIESENVLFTVKSWDLIRIL